MKTYLINASECNPFELDMIMNAKIQGLIMPVSFERIENGDIALSYESPIGKTELSRLIQEDYFDSQRFHDFLSKIIVLKGRLEAYMLNPENLVFNSDSIWYDPLTTDYQFVYLPENRKDVLQELHLYRHIFIESRQISESNKDLLNLMREKDFDLVSYSELLINSKHLKKKNMFFHRFSRSKQEEHNLPISRTIQKSRKSCLLDSVNPSILHELHFNNNMIGRSDDCNIQIDNPSISRKHAVISKNQLDFTLQDLDSSNGTLCNGQPVSEPTTLYNGDKLQFGDKEFIFIL